MVKETKHLIKENKKLNKLLQQGQADDPHMHKLVHGGEVQQYLNEIKEKHDKFDGKIPEECFFTDMDDIFEHIQTQQETIRQVRDLGYEVFFFEKWV